MEWLIKDQEGNVRHKAESRREAESVMAALKLIAEVTSSGETFSIVDP